jgi:hypothetical protein
MPRQALVRRPAPAAAGCLLVVTAAPAVLASRAETSCHPDGTTLSLIAFDGKLDKRSLAAPAGHPSPSTSRTSTAAWRTTSRSTATARQLLFRGDLLDGPGVTDYPVPALPAGRWFFRNNRSVCGYFRR